MTSSHLFGQYDCDYMAPPPDPNGGPQLNGPCDFRGVDPPVGGNFCDPENDDPFTIRVYVHVMTRMDGTGAQSLSLIHDALNRMVRDYAPLAISFSFESLEYLPVNEDLYDFATGDYADLISLNYHADGIDIYFCGPGMYNNGVGGDMQDIVEGNWNLPRKASVIGGGNSEYCDHPLLITTHILSHEVGHNLGLLHTGSYNFNNPDVPNVDELCLNDLANCHCQDHVSDTGLVPLDEDCLIDNCDCDDEDCPSSLTNIINNIMTARAPVQCGIAFTPGQGYRIKRYLTTCDSVMQVVETGRIVIGNGFDITLEEPGIGCLPDIEIEDGGKLTVKTDLTFGEGKGIYIRKGGRLTVMGSRLSGCDGKYWKGIEVDGDPGSVQFPPDYQGFVTINSASSVRSVVEKAEFPLTVAGGGVALVRNTDFLNCGEAAFYDYPNNNISFFEGCDFLRDNGYGLADWPAQLFLRSVNGIDMTDCNLSTVNPPHNATGGYGILGFDAQFKVQYSTIEGYRAGIWGYSWFGNAVGHFIVQRCTLRNNRIGIASWSNNNIVVEENVFEGIGAFNHPDFHRGLTLRNSSAFTVRNNTFSGIGTNPNTTGIFADDTGGGPNEIVGNSFEKLHAANRAQNDNRGNELGSGLQYLCNTNISENMYDFLVFDEGVAENQGGAGSEATKNEFSHYNASFGDFNNQSFNGILYYHGNTFVETPQMNYFYNIEPVVSSIDFNCANDGGGSNSIDIKLTEQEEQTIIQDFNVAENNYNQLFNTYSSLLNGGYTEDSLSTEIANATSANISLLKQDLLNYSPYLTRNVLETVVYRNDIFTDSDMDQILSVNPDELRSLEFQSFLFTELNNTLVDTILAHQFDTNARTNMEAGLTGYKLLMHRAANRIVKSELADTTGLNRAKYRIWLRKKASVETAYELVGSYMAEGNYATARQIRDSIPLLFELEGNELMEHSYYDSLTEIVIKQLQDSIHYSLFDSAKVLQLQYIADNSSGIAGVLAQGLLNVFYGHNYEILPKIPGGQQQELFAPKPEITGNSVYQPLTIIPNPASETVTFRFDPGEGNPVYRLEVFDVSGRLLKRFDVDHLQEYIQWNTSHLEPGIYYCKTNLSVNSYPPQKLVIVR